MDEGKMAQFKIQMERLRNFIITKKYWVGVTRSQMKTIRNQAKVHLLEGDTLFYTGFKGRKTEVITSIQRAREIVQMAHASGSQGHCGVEATTKRIARDFSWRSIKADVRKYIKACVTCQNYEKVKTQAPLTISIKMSQPLVGMDLIGTMPNAKALYSRKKLRPKKKVIRMKVINSLTERFMMIREQSPVQDTVSIAPSHQPSLTSNFDFSKDYVVPDNGASPYQEEKAGHFDRWEEIHQQLLGVHTELSAVADHSQCIYCGVDAPTIRCLDCGSRALFCEEDFVEHHKNATFHCPEIWNGHCFVPYAANLPVLVHNKHKVPSCSKHTRGVTVIGMRGRPQLFTFEFCSCESDTVTLLRHCLWASSPETPSVAFELDVMEWLYALVFKCHVSVEGFVDALAARLDKMENMISKVIKAYQAQMTDAFMMYMAVVCGAAKELVPVTQEKLIGVEDVVPARLENAIAAENLVPVKQENTFAEDQVSVTQEKYVTGEDLVPVKQENTVTEDLVPVTQEHCVQEQEALIKLEEKAPKNQDEESGEVLARTGPKSLWRGAEVHGVQQYFILDPAGLRVMTCSSIDSFLTQQPVVQTTSVAGQNYLLRNRKIEQT